MILDPKIWGPRYWFVLQTIAMNYPLYPNNISKKKYYDFIQNLPLLIPVNDIANAFSKLLDDFPVIPYLDSRESFIKWLHFIHNKINLKVNLPEITLEESLKNYYDNYRDEKCIINSEYISKKKIFLILLTFILFIISFFMYRNG
jgi:fumarate reductase subunit C